MVNSREDIMDVLVTDPVEVELANGLAAQAISAGKVLISTIVYQI